MAEPNRDEAEQAEKATAMAIRGGAAALAGQQLGAAQGLYHPDGRAVDMHAVPRGGQVANGAGAAGGAAPGPQAAAAAAAEAAAAAAAAEAAAAAAAAAAAGMPGGRRAAAG